MGHVWPGVGGDIADQRLQTLPFHPQGGRHRLHQYAVIIPDEGDKLSLRPGNRRIAVGNRRNRLGLEEIAQARVLAIARQPRLEGAVVAAVVLDHQFKPLLRPAHHLVHQNGKGFIAVLGGNDDAEQGAGHGSRLCNSDTISMSMRHPVAGIFRQRFSLLLVCVAPAGKATISQHRWRKGDGSRGARTRLKSRGPRGRPANHEKSEPPSAAISAGGVLRAWASCP